MGRKTDYTEKVKSGPGRKTKKQGNPTFAPAIVAKSATGTEKKLSSRQKKRLKKREEKERGMKEIRPVKAPSKINICKILPTLLLQKEGSIFCLHYLMWGVFPACTF